MPGAVAVVDAVTAKREGCVWAVLAMLLVVSAGLLWFFNSESMDIDSCLDSGGRWGDDKTCEFEAPTR